MPTVTVIQPTLIEEKSAVIRCAAYCRVSSDSEDQLNSFMAQLKYYENFLADSETETLINVYADEGITGTREDKREDFQRMMSDCRKGKIDRIYTKSISRFARNTRDCLKNIRELKFLGITVFFEKEGIDTANMTDEMMITIMGGLAQEESTSISQNMRWSIQKRMQNGTYKIARPPFGFDIIDGNLEINEAQAKIVNQIFNWYISGCGLLKIANILNENNIPSNQLQGKWTADVVKYILKNERYIGDAVFQKNYVTETLPHLKLRNYGEKPKYYVTDTNPQIVEKRVFETVQRLLKERYKPYSNDGHLMSGKIICSKCEATYKFKKCGKKSYWTCRTHDKKSDLCENGRILESKIHGAFIALHNKLLYNYNQILLPLQVALQDLKLRQFNGNSNIMELHKEIAKLKEQVHVLARLKTKGFLDDVKYLEQTAELNAKVNKLQSDLKKITRVDDEDEALDQIEMLIDHFEKQNVPISEFDESAFENIVEKIVVINQNELEFHLYGRLRLREMI